MKRIRQWFIGDYLAKTEDVFERAKIELLYSYTMFFSLLGIYIYVNLIIHHFWYHFYLISFAVVALGSLPFLLKYTQNVRLASNWYITQQLIVSVGSIVIQEARTDMSGGFWGMVTVLFAFFLYGKKWGLIITVIYFVCSSLPAAFTHLYDIPDNQQMPDTPEFFIVPLALNIYVVWMFIKTREGAEQKINRQRNELAEKNKEILDSIHYAKRIQTSLMPPEKYIARTLDKLKR